VAMRGLPKGWRKIAVVRMPGEGKQVSLAGKPVVFLVTGQDTRHTSMFDWTLPPGFSTGTHVHRVQEETFMCWKANASGMRAASLSTPSPAPTNSSRRICLTISPMPATSRRG